MTHILLHALSHAGPACREAGAALLHFALSPLGGWTLAAVQAWWERG